MTDKQIKFSFSEVASYNDIDAFVSDIALSSMMEDIELNEGFYEQLSSIWKSYNYSIKEISELSELNQTQLSERFMIPLRTVQHWFNGDREIPIYLKILICENLGLWKR